MAAYELWLTDDTGKRFAALTKPFFLSYTRTTLGLGTVYFGVSFKDFSASILPYFRPDWRVEVWRSAGTGIPLRREDVFLLRKPNVSRRATDGMLVLEFYGRNGIDLLMRRTVTQRGGTSWATKTDTIDNMMKTIVREQMLYGSAVDKDGVSDNTRAYPQNEFLVQPNSSLGPSITRAFAGRNVNDILKDLKSSSQQLNLDLNTNRKIYFDVIPLALNSGSAPSGSILGWEFRTYADLRGANRTGGMIFSMENENLADPSYYIDYLDEVNTVVVQGNGSGLSQALERVSDATRVAASRWNLAEKTISAGSETTTTGLQSAGRAELYKGKPKERLDATILNSPGSNNTPRSLYGLDWDLGDLVPTSFAGKNFNMEINTIYVAVDDAGVESITGKSEVVA